MTYLTQIFSLYLFLGLQLFAFLSVGRAEQVVVKRLCVTQVVDHPALNRTREGLMDTLAAGGYVCGRNLICTFENAQGNFLVATQIAQKFMSDQPDAIVALSTPSAQPFIKLNRSRAVKVPVVFSSVTDPLSAGLVADLKAPAYGITGVSNFIQLEPQFALFKALLNKQTQTLKLGVIYNPGDANSVKMVNAMERLQASCGIELSLQAATKSVEVLGAAAQLVSKVDAVFITNDNTALSAFSGIVKIALKAKVPVFTSDVDLVEKGALAALGPNQYELGCQTAQMLLQVFNQTATIDQLPVGFPSKLELYINLKMAQALCIQIPDTVLDKADKLL